MPITRIQTVYVPTEDVVTTAAFYEKAFGAPPRFRDDDRWVQFSVGGVGFAVASRAEAASGAVATVAVFEADDPADHDRLVAAGAEPLDLRDMGSHGRTRTYRDPGGQIIQLFWRA